MTPGRTVCIIVSLQCFLTVQATKDVVDFPGVKENQNVAKIDDIGLTLTGMMGALADIQERGDAMVSSINKQREVLDSLERSTEEAQLRRQTMEAASIKLEEDKERLEEQIKQLEDKKSGLVSSMRTDEQKLSSFRTGLAPLEVKISAKKSELSKFESLVLDKKSELDNYQREVDKVSKELGKVNDSLSATFQTPPSPVLLGILVISLILNLAALSQIGRLPFPRRREDSLVPSEIFLQDHPSYRNNIDSTTLSSKLEPPKMSKRIESGVNYRVASPKVNDRNKKVQKMRRRKLQDRHSFEMENMYDDYFEDLLREL